MVAISVHRASCCDGIAVVATPNSLHCETAFFGSCASQKQRANQNTGGTWYLHRGAHDPPGTRSTTSTRELLDRVATPDAAGAKPLTWQAQAVNISTTDCFPAFSNNLPVIIATFQALPDPAQGNYPAASSEGNFPCLTAVRP
jgi:hypothetical protein